MIEPATPAPEQPTPAPAPAPAERGFVGDPPTYHDRIARARSIFEADPNATINSCRDHIHDVFGIGVDNRTLGKLRNDIRVARGYEPVGSNFPIKRVDARRARKKATDPVRAREMLSADHSPSKATREVTALELFRRAPNTRIKEAMEAVRLEHGITLSSARIAELRNDARHELGLPGVGYGYPLSRITERMTKREAVAHNGTARDVGGVKVVRDSPIRVLSDDVLSIAELAAEIAGIARLEIHIDRHGKVETVRYQMHDNRTTESGHDARRH